MPAGNVHVPSSAEGLQNDPANAELWTKVDEFKSKADEFYNEWQRLRGMRQAAARDPEALKEWNRLMGQADGVAAKVSDVEKAVNQAKSWGLSVFGLNGLRDSLGELGAVQFVVALVIGAIAWLGTWLADAYQLDRKLTYQEELIAQGISPERAAETASGEATGGGFVSQLGQGIGKGLAIAAAAGLLFYFLLEKKRGF